MEKTLTPQTIHTKSFKSGVDTINNVQNATMTNEVVSNLYWDNDPFAKGIKGTEVQILVNQADEVVQFQNNNVFGRTEVFLEGRPKVVLTEETNFGNLIADANLAFARNIDTLDFLGVVPRSNNTVLVSIVNGGGIRASIGEVGDLGELLPPEAKPEAGKKTGEISKLDIVNALPFNNALTLLTVTRQELKYVVEHGLAGTNKDAASSQFPQVAGLSFSFDPNQTRIKFDSAESGKVINNGERVQNLNIVDRKGEIVDVIVKDGEFQGDPDREVRLVTTNYLADGGDGYPFPAFGKDVVNVQNALGQLLFLDPFIKFDESRVTDTVTGLIFIDDTMVPVFDFSNPKMIQVDVNAGTLVIETDLLFSPEEGVAFKDEGLPGTDGGDARINAKIVPSGDNFEIVSGTTSITFESSVFERLGLMLFDVDNGATPAEGFEVGYRIVSNKGDNLIFSLEDGFTPIRGAIKHIGTATLEYLSSATFAPAGTEQDALAEYLVEFFRTDNGSTTPTFSNLETPPEKDTRIVNLAKVKDMPALTRDSGVLVFGTTVNDTLNTVTDFTSSEDAIAIAALGVGFKALNIF
ncbi:hypothetical protein NUACC21_56690 [Scytonema sp. NUACC21]